MKKYTLEVIEKNGNIKMNRTNDGFTAFELLGFLEITRTEIIEMAKGKRIPDIIERKVIQKVKKTKVKHDKIHENS